MILKLFVFMYLIFYAFCQILPIDRSALSRRRVKSRFNLTSDPDVPVEESTEDLSNSNNIFSLLHRINDRLSSLSTLNEQQLRRLETFEYRITKLEVQIQEKIEGLRSDLKEVSRRVQQIDWQSSKTESTLDVLKSDTTFLKQALEHYRVTSLQDANVGSSTEFGSDITNKLQLIIRTSQTLLNSITGLQSDVAILKRNVTKITNTTSSLDLTLPLLLTTKHFQRSIFDLERHSFSYSIRQGVVNVQDSDLPHDCSELNGKKSGVYKIRPAHVIESFFVSCDLETNDGGWTVIQLRNEGALEFYKTWHDYKHGFGNIAGEFWLGLEKMHALTNAKVNEMYIELEDFESTKTYAHYSVFAIGSEIEGYPISFLGTYNGTAGDSLIYHAGQKFSTFDMDHDNWPQGNCAQSHLGAWWYNNCDTSNLNGRYLNGEVMDENEFQGMYWSEWHGSRYSLKGSKIMIRPFKDTSPWFSELSNVTTIRIDKNKDEYDYN